MFTDTHCHVTNEYYEDISKVINDAIDNKVNRLIISGSDSKSNKEIIEIIKAIDSCYAVLGLHPEVVNSYSEEDIIFIEENSRNNRVIGIGEIGLDYHYTKEYKLEQKKLFERQLAIAEKNSIPVVIHSRDATMDTINILKKYKVNGVIHSFSGSYESALEYIKMGFLLGINGVITFKNASLKEVIKKIDLEYIVIETDCPYLTPHPYRGCKNEPKYVLEIAKFIAALKDVTLDDLAKITNRNIERIFDI